LTAESEKEVLRKGNMTGLARSMTIFLMKESINFESKDQLEWGYMCFVFVFVGKVVSVPCCLVSDPDPQLQSHSHRGYFSMNTTCYLIIITITKQQPLISLVQFCLLLILKLIFIGGEQYIHKINQRTK
jgi:hypothetical protein